MGTNQESKSKLTRRAVMNTAVAAFAARGPVLRGFQQPPEVAKAATRNTTDDPRFNTPSEPANTPMGGGKGIHPGRVVWAHDPEAAAWDGNTGAWWDDANTDQHRVDTMFSAALRSLTGMKSDAEAWDALFRFFNEARGLGRSGYRRGEKVAVKLNSNQDRPGDWRKGAGMPTPQVAYALLSQLITAAGVPGQDVTFYDASRYIGDPIYDRVRANPDPNFQAVKFSVNQRMAGKGRTEALPDKTEPIHFSRAGLPTAYPPQCVTGAKYLINVALARAHSLMGITATAKNHFGSIYFEGVGFSPRPLHSYASRDLPLGSYNCLVDLIASKHFGGKTLLYLLDFLYVAESQNTRVIKYQSLGNHWAASLFLSQDPVAIDSVALDFVRNEPSAGECRGKPENYLHEAALAGKAPSGTAYAPDGDGGPASLGVHEHWNNPADRKYSRNLGKGEGIELVRV